MDDSLGLTLGYICISYLLKFGFEAVKMSMRMRQGFIEAPQVEIWAALHLSHRRLGLSVLRGLQPKGGATYYLYLCLYL